MPAVVVREYVKAFRVDRLFIAVVPFGAGKFKLVAETFDGDGLLDGQEAVQAKAEEVRLECRAKLDRKGMVADDRGTSSTTDPESGATPKL
jgi:hypothetical protein